MERDYLPATGAGAIARRGRELLASGGLTHRQFALLDLLLWRCRRHGRAVARVSYSVLMELARVARSTVAEALRALEAAGLIQRTKVRVLVPWGGGTASRQATSLYRLLPPRTESSSRTDSKPQEIQLVAQGLGKAQEQAARALAEIRRARTDTLHRQWLARYGVNPS